jgi:parallel beta-helix repeat protein
MTTYYVSSEIGSNRNAGTSSTAPLASLQAAADLVQPGDTVEVMNGTYTGPQGGDVVDITTSGTASAPITFEAAPGQTPVINSSGSWNAIKIEASYIVVNGFTVVGDAANYTLSQALAGYSTGSANLDGAGINVTGNPGVNVPNHITIENNAVYNEPGTGIGSWDADYLNILNNVVYDNAHWSAFGNSGISIFESGNSDRNSGVHDVTSGNLVFGNAQLVPTNGAGTITDGEGIILDTNTAFGFVGEILVENNTVYGNGSAGIESFRTNGAVITENTVYGNNTANVLQTASVDEIFINQSNNDTVTNNITTAPRANYAGNATGGAVSGTSYALESIEPAFHHDLNGDGVLGRTVKVIQKDRSTSLTLVGNQYYYLDGSGGSGPALKYNSANVRAGEFGRWMPIGAVQTASGYDVAWKNTGTGQYTVWSTDSDGNYEGFLTGAAPVSGTSSALESLEPVFRQDLNRNSVNGLTTKKLIQTDGPTSLTEVANQYYLYGSSGSGPSLKYNGANVTVGEFGAWTPIGAIQTASGYDVAWKNTGTGQYTVWSTDSNGNYKGFLTGGAVSGTSSALESLEPVFRQDLNRDGVIGLYAAPGTARQITNALAGTTGSATIGIGATLELTAADSASVIFAGSTGTLRLDHSSTFSGKIFKFSGNGSLSGSDHIDLRDVKYSSVHDSYANGVLTVKDGGGETAKLSFNGSYTLANFKFANDGSGGTIVYDPPVPSSNQSSPRTVGASSLAENSFGSNLALFTNYIASTLANASHGGAMVIAEASQIDQSLLCSPKHT